jgi:hypothetical protein
LSVLHTERTATLARLDLANNKGINNHMLEAPKAPTNTRKAVGDISFALVAANKTEVGRHND